MDALLSKVFANAFPNCDYLGIVGDCTEKNCFLVTHVFFLEKRQSRQRFADKVFQVIDGRRHHPAGTGIAKQTLNAEMP